MGLPSLHTQSTSDLTIVVEDRKIHVHKAILRMRCGASYNTYNNYYCMQ